MAVLEHLPGAIELIRRLVVTEQRTYEQTSNELKRAYPGLNAGLSARSVRRFCNNQGIQRTSRLTGGQLDRMVLSCIQAVSSKLHYP